MNYYAKKDTIYTITKYERIQVEKLRKISILKNIPFEEWTNWELQDLIEEYESYFRFCRIKRIPVSIYEFLLQGIYEKRSIYENFKSKILKPNVVKSEKIKSIKLKK